MSEGPISEEIAAIEAALGSLTPAAGGLDRDRVMFLAGRVSGERLQPARPVAARRWPSVMAASLVAMTSATAVLLVLLMVRPGLPTADRKFGPAQRASLLCRQLRATWRMTLIGPLFNGGTRTTDEF